MADETKNIAEDLKSARPDVNSDGANADRVSGDGAYSSNDTLKSHAGASIEAPKSAPDGSSSGPHDTPELPAFSDRIRSKIWWRNTRIATLLFARHCAVAAAIWTLAGTVMIYGVSQCSLQMRAGVLTLESYLTSTIIFLATIATTFILMAWSLGVWLVKVTAFARSFALLPMYSDGLDTATIKSMQKQAIEDSWKRKAFFAKFWFFVSLFLAIPMACLGLMVVAKILPAMSKYGQFPITIDPMVEIVLSCLIMLASAVLTQMSVVSLVVSAQTKKEPLDAAKSAVALSIRYFGPALFLTIVVMLINVAVSTPQVLFRLNDPTAIFMAQQNVPRLLLENVWQGLTSVVLWTFACTPVCELLRGKVE